MSGIRKKLLPLISLFLAAAVVAGLFGGLGQAAAKIQLPRYLKPGREWPQKQKNP